MTKSPGDDRRNRTAAAQAASQADRGDHGRRTGACREAAALVRRLPGPTLTRAAPPSARDRPRVADSPSAPPRGVDDRVLSLHTPARREPEADSHARGARV